MKKTTILERDDDRLSFEMALSNRLVAFNSRDCDNKRNVIFLLEANSGEPVSEFFLESDKFDTVFRHVFINFMEFSPNAKYLLVYN